MWRPSAVCPCSTQWKREWLQVTPVRGGQSRDQNWESLGEFGAGSHEGRGDRSGQTSPNWGIWVCPPCPRGWGKKERALGEAPRFSLEVKKHFPWGETEQTAWRGNEGFWLHVRQISASKIQVTLPWGRGMDRWLLDVLSSLVFL